MKLNENSYSPIEHKQAKSFGCMCSFCSIGATPSHQAETNVSCHQLRHNGADSSGLKVFKGFSWVLPGFCFQDFRYFIGVWAQGDWPTHPYTKTRDSSHCLRATFKP